MQLIITDRNGWEKAIAFDKAVLRIGSSLSNDLPLADPQIAPTHLQIHYLPEEFGCKVLNLGSDLKVLHQDHEDILRSYARTELKNADELILGDYRLRVQLPTTTKTIQSARSLSATLNFPATTLYPHTPAVGWITIKNLGEQSPCQFHVQVSGLAADCVQIDPIPLLYSGAQEEVRLQLFHRGLYPRAGLTELTLRIFAPTDYPGEQVLIEQGIYVTPVFEQTFEILDDPDADAGAVAPSVHIPEPDVVAQSAISSVPPVLPPPPSAEHELPPPAVAPLSPPSAAFETEKEAVQKTVVAEKEKIAVQRKPEPKSVVVRDLPEEFWDEE